MRCKLFAVLASFAVSLSLSLSVSAESTEVEISDLYENDDAETTDNSGFFYDSETQLYRYEFANGEKLFATAPLSAENAVPYMWLSWSENVEVIVLLNGNDAGFTKGNMLTESGNYSVYAVSEGRCRGLAF